MSKKISGLHLLFNLLCFIIAVIGCVYLIIYDFRQAAIWSILSGTLSLCNVQLQVLHLLDKLADWHSPETLSGIKCLAFIGSTLTSAAILWYGFNFFYIVLPILAPGDSIDMKYIQSLSWSCLCLVDCLSLYWAAHRSTNILIQPETQPLLA